MESIQHDNGAEVNLKRQNRNIFGWAGFIVSIGVLLEQIYMHGVSLVTYFIPYVFSGRLSRFLSSTDPLNPLLFKIIFVLELVMSVFFFAYPFSILVCLIIRKKFVPRLLVIFAAIAGIYNILHIILLNILPDEVKRTLSFNTVESFVFIGIDILLFLYYLASKRFRSLFIR